MSRRLLRLLWLLCLAGTTQAAEPSRLLLSIRNSDFQTTFTSQYLAAAITMSSLC